MTTIGYGDRVAKTSVTRAIVILLLIWGNFWSSIFISVLFPYVQLSLFEKKALNQYRRTKLRSQIKKFSKDVVGQMVMINYYDGKEGTEKKNMGRQLKIFSLLRKIKVLKEEMSNVVGETHYFVDEILGGLKWDIILGLFGGYKFCDLGILVYSEIICFETLLFLDILRIADSKSED